MLSELIPVIKAGSCLHQPWRGRSRGVFDASPKPWLSPQLKQTVRRCVWCRGAGPAATRLPICLLIHLRSSLQTQGCLSRRGFDGSSADPMDTPYGTFLPSRSHCATHLRGKSKGHTGEGWCGHQGMKEPERMQRSTTNSSNLLTRIISLNPQSFSIPVSSRVSSGPQKRCSLGQTWFWLHSHLCQQHGRCSCSQVTHPSIHPSLAGRSICSEITSPGMVVGVEGPRQGQL